jgi:hypothetical protein
MSLAFFARRQAPLLPVVVSTRFARDNFATTRRTKLGLVLTLIASRLEVISRSHPAAKPAMMCTAIENCVFTAITFNCYYNSHRIEVAQAKL